MPPPIVADLRPCADGSAVRTFFWWPAVAAGSQHAYNLRQLRHGTDRQTDGPRYRLMPPTAGG